MTLRIRTLLIISLLILGTVLVLSALLTWNAYQAILTQQQTDGLLIARLLARTASIVEEFPRAMDEVIGEQMVVEATIAAHLIDVAVKAGMTPDEINQHLVLITDETVLSEFWITDAKGHAYLRSLKDVDFTFSPDSLLQPQASVFWTLLSGDQGPVIQDAQVREVDNQIFKYVGVGGIDQPRIVQVGYNASVLDELREKVGVQRLVDQLVAGGDISAIRVLDQSSTTLVFSAAKEYAPETLTISDISNLDDVINSGNEISYLDGQSLRVIVPIHQQVGSELTIGAIMVYLPADSLFATVRKQIYQALIVAVLVLALGILIALAFSRGLMRPVEQISAAASAIQGGSYHLESLTDVVSRRDELGNLGRVFDSMAREVMMRDRRLRLLRVIIPMGVKLSAEKDFNRLLETIMTEAQQVTNADAGTLYLLDGDELQFVTVYNESLGLAMGGSSGKEITFPALKLHREDGQPNYANVATYVALNGEMVNIADAYSAKGFDFSGTKSFDEGTGYHSQSFLTVPLQDDAGNVIGVLQLINARDEEKIHIIPFTEDEVIDSLVLLASAALAGYVREEKLRKEIALLRIEVDQVKQARQVAEITETEYFKKLQAKVKEMRSDKQEKE